MKFLDTFFKLTKNSTNVRTEVFAGLTTFLTMAYIIFVNPTILADAGMPQDAVFVATCVAAAVGSLMMGLYANYPVALAPGMGLNAYFSYTIVKSMGVSWQIALGAVFISGCLFLLITLCGMREAMVKHIPQSMRMAIIAGIGLFLALIALQHAGIVVAHPVTLVTLGNINSVAVILSGIGFFLIVTLDYFKITGAVFIGILAVTLLSFFFDGNQFAGVVAMPPSIEPVVFKLDIMGALSLGLLNIILILFLMEVFDATGTLTGLAHRVGLSTESQKKRFGKALVVDGASMVAGSMLGTSSVTAYMESATGMQVGGRTGLTAVVVAILFLMSLFIAPLAKAVPIYATAPALFYVGCLMMRELAVLDWDDVTESMPAVITAVMMPFTYSIATGIAFGFMSYAGLKLFTGRARQVSLVVWIIAGLFLFKFVYLGK